jgi:hypothetical protein
MTGGKAGGIAVLEVLIFSVMQRSSSWVPYVLLEAEYQAWPPGSTRSSWTLDDTRPSALHWLYAGPHQILLGRVLSPCAGAEEEGA